MPYDPYSISSAHRTCAAASTPWSMGHGTYTTEHAHCTNHVLWLSEQVLRTMTPSSMVYCHWIWSMALGYFPWATDHVLQNIEHVLWRTYRGRWPTKHVLPVGAKKTPATLDSKLKHMFEKWKYNVKTLPLRRSQKWVEAQKYVFENLEEIRA